MAEKDIVSKVVQKYAAMQQAAPTATQAQSPATAAKQQPNKLGGVKQPLATAGGNKIKLGRFGKK